MIIQGQINILEQMEREEREKKYYEAFRERYRKWLHTDGDKTIKENDPERATMVSYPHDTHCDIYSQCIHVCNEMPEDVYIWINTTAGCIYNEYWVLNRRGEVGGKRIDICPYCGVNLRSGKGDIKLIKQTPDRFKDKSTRNYYKLDEIDMEEKEA